MEASLQKQFRNEGYVLLRGVITPEEIAAMREAGEKHFVGERSHMFTDELLRIPCLAALSFNPKIVAGIRRVFGEGYATVTQFSMSANLHNPQWHRDSQSQEGNEYLYDPDYRVSKCAVYLQDNDREWGGGMEILPRSHLPGYLGYRTPLSRGNPIGKLARGLQRAALRLRDRRLAPLWLPLKAGDALLFHANLIHRASQPDENKKRGGYKNVALLDPPRDKFKYLFDWEVSPDNRYLRVYIEHQLRRARAEGGLFGGSMNVRFPDDYDPALVTHIQKLGLKVVNYSDVGTATREAA